MPANRQIKRPTGAQTAGIVICVMMVVLLLTVNAAVQMIYGGPRGNELSVATVFSSPQDVSVDELIKKGLDYTLTDMTFSAESGSGSVSFAGSEISLEYDYSGAGREFSTDAQGQLVVTETTGVLRYDLTALRAILAPLAGEMSVAVIEPYYEIDYDGATLTLHQGTGGYGVDPREFMESLAAAIASGSVGTVSCEPRELEAPVLEMAEIHKRACTDPVDAHMITHDDNSQAYIKEVIGISFDLAAAQSASPDASGTYVIPITVTKPSVTLDDVLENAFPDLLASYKTNYFVTAVSRSSNLALAAEKINGTILQPGQQFSFNDVVGERTAANGFKKATVYLNEGTGEDYGGGICQVSSTLYYTCILADLQIDERRNHKYTVTYMVSKKGGDVVYGNDATVNWGYTDYKFSNDKNNPIRIEIYAKGGELYCNIWGTADGRTSDFAYEQTYSSPYMIKYMPASAGSSDQAGHTGRTVNVYRIRYADDVEVSRELEHTNRYQAMTQIIYTSELPQGYQYGVEYPKDYDPSTAPTTTTTTTTTSAATTTTTTAAATTAAVTTAAPAAETTTTTAPERVEP